MIPGAFLLIAQASVATATGAAPLPDIEIVAHVEAREVTIEQDGPIRVQLTAEPGTSAIEVRRSQPAGTRSYRNLTIDARLAAVISQDDDGTLVVDTASSTGEQPQ